MKIGIIGTGNMGRTLGIRWAENGHDVFFGARRPEQAEATAKLATVATGKPALQGTNDEAATFGEVLFYSPRDIDPKDVLSDISVLNGKIVIDPANEMPSRPDWLNYQNIETISLAERLQARIPAAHVVKAFNTISQENVTHTAETLRQYGVSCFIAGNEESARNVVAGLAEELGFTAIDGGTVEAARHFEALARYIIYQMGERNSSAYATINVHVLPISSYTEKYGGRELDRSYS